ncbi:Tex family protein [Fulvivirga sedimenti]|uniref:RNA-binding transcriptional accessory protein n=1 Tax=Fulvivirga sedimenti TaxID=2879465 RepID=A0A9X1KVV0_9BACT|nr:Tex family protein [Fulvivirga sedimenti]MCA6073279.1 RNA-binding transcriptional accessory protein [Fulvivirga sedimenti]
MTYSAQIASELSLQDKFVSAVITMLDEGATIPFMARYRKERTGSMDEVDIAKVRDRYEQLQELESRKEAVLKSIEKQEKLTPELENSIRKATTLAEVEDIYLPYKPKRKTRASQAREKGLEPLSELIFTQDPGVDPEAKAADFINEELGVATIDDALQGARDIIAERINEDAEARKFMRSLFEKEGVISSRVLTGKEEEGAKYRDYFDWSERISQVPSHRLLAMRRGEKEMILSLEIGPDDTAAITKLEQHFLKNQSGSAEQVKMAIADGYKRLMHPSLETEIRIVSKSRADEDAIHVFADNLRQLLLAAPFGQHNVLALDPGFRTGCKLVVLDKQGKLLHNTTIYPNAPQNQTAAAASLILELTRKFNIEAVAIGNGTASRETEAFVKKIGLPREMHILMVNESGASIYSASEVAREEFPDHDVTVRGAVSIGRRLMDPLAELVKIDPKSIGVGQYQHDVDQNQLKKSLDDVVMSCVNSVGVELNTASKELLSYVSGLGPQLATNMVKYRNENGAFKSRTEILKVARMGEKSFEQAAGFLRIKSSKNPLDNSAVHPESYHIVEKMAADLGCAVTDLMQDEQLRKKIDLKKYITDEVGLPTLQDILLELSRPGRDPREKFESFSFDESVHEVEDLKKGMVLPGIVTNVTNFGAFVDIGVHQDGLVHISHLSDKFVSNPAEVVSVQQQVSVTVLEVDINRKRISLSMKSEPFGEKKQKPQKKAKREESRGGGDMHDKLNALRNKFGK